MYVRHCCDRMLNYGPIFINLLQLMSRELYQRDPQLSYV